MSALSHRRTTTPKRDTFDPFAELVPGDRLSQPEFHRRYEAHPDDRKFELIDGVVYMASPMRLPHARCDRRLAAVFDAYEENTPGVEGVGNATVILGEDAETQPDQLLRITPEFGGATRDTPEQYVAGGPELIAEIAHSTVAIDLHLKREDYRRGGVCEYLVVCLAEEVVRWFDLTRNEERPIPDDGILKSWMFPGLWIDTKALFRRDSKALLKCLKAGLKTPEHKEFIARLQAQRGGQNKPKAARTRSPRKTRRRPKS